MATEADTCRDYVVPRLEAAGWGADPHSIGEQVTFTDGRIVVAGGKTRRRPGKRADYLLRYTRDFPIAVVEAKRAHKLPSDGLQQAGDYAEILGLKFAYATNGAGLVEFDYLTGLERELDATPSPEELWSRLRGGEGLAEESVAQKLLTPAYPFTGKRLRYYQEIAVNRVVQAVLQGRRRLLLTMATGTGKTLVAFQICCKLWNARWNRAGEHRKPRVLYLSDRNLLVDDPKDNQFDPFGEARFKIENGRVVKSREIYFAIYQALAGDEHRAGLYRKYGRDFFDLIIVDECHRGSAREDSSWREILEYFRPAYQLGMTATPLRQDYRDTYDYFGPPLYQYSLGQGIQDGFLAPYRVHRVVTSFDALGWRPSPADLDRYGRPIPDEEYQTGDFERAVALKMRTEAIARHLTDFLKRTDRFAKTIVFCVDQDHADEMRRALNNLNADLARQYSDYVCRVTAAEGDIGLGHLGRFKDPEKRTPALVTTSRLLTTGVDVPTCKNIVLARVVNSMTEFKQIIGRGTRVRDDHGKLFFSILDYTGSATRAFADPQFDGAPALETTEWMDDDGRVSKEQVVQQEESEGEQYETPEEGPGRERLGDPLYPRKFYFDGGQVEIVAQVVYELDPDGKQLRVVRFTDYAAEKVRTLYPSAPDLRQRWADPDHRSEVIARLEERGIDFAELARATGRPEADPFDLLCHVAYNGPLRTRRERADRLRQEKRDFFDRYGPEARSILEELLEKYAEHGATQFALPQVLKVPPISSRGNAMEIAGFFGGAEQLREAVNVMQALLYAA